MGENIGQKNKRIIVIKRYQVKNVYTPDVRYVHTKLCSDEKSLKARTSTKLKIAEDQKFQKVVTNTARVIRLGQKYHYYQE